MGLGGPRNCRNLFVTKMATSPASSSSPRGIRVAFAPTPAAADDPADDGASWFERIFCGCGTACGTVDPCLSAADAPTDHDRAPVSFEDEPGYAGVGDDFASFDRAKPSDELGTAPRGDDASAAARAAGPSDEEVKAPAPEEYEPPTPGVGVLHAAQRWRTRDAPGDAKRLVQVRLPAPP